MKIREAALVPALIAAVIQFLLPFLVSADQELVGAINAAVAFAAALVTAFMVSAEKGLAFLAGAANSLIQLAFAFGVPLTEGQQALLGTILTMIAAAFTRQNVVAPIAPANVKTVQGPQNVVTRQTGGNFS